MRQKQIIPHYHDRMQVAIWIDSDFNILLVMNLRENTTRLKTRFIVQIRIHLFGS